MECAEDEDAAVVDVVAEPKPGDIAICLEMMVERLNGIGVGLLIERKKNERRRKGNEKLSIPEYVNVIVETIYGSFGVDRKCNRFISLPLDGCNTNGENGKQVH